MFLLFLIYSLNSPSNLSVKCGLPFDKPLAFWGLMLFTLLISSLQHPSNQTNADCWLFYKPLGRLLEAPVAFDVFAAL